MIKADELTHNSLMQSIKDGQFYSSQGPQIHNIYIEDGYITVECSEAQSIFVLTADRHGAVYHQDDGKCTKMTFKLEDWFGYVRFEIFDKERKMAMSNPYFLKDYLD